MSMDLWDIVTPILEFMVFEVLHSVLLYNFNRIIKGQHAKTFTETT